jgi:hypothetical protein
LHPHFHDFRPLIKDSLLAAGIGSFFVLDGIGALLGIPAGNNRGTAAEILKELSKYCATDGVHFNEIGYANMAKVIDSAVSGIESGTLTKADISGPSSGSKQGAVFFWRGFNSPVGYSGPRSNTLRPPTNQTANLNEDCTPTGTGTGTSSTGNTGSAGMQFTRGGSRGGHNRFFYKGRNCPYWKKK